MKKKTSQSISLMKPLLPPYWLLSEYLKIPYKNHQWSNFGFCYEVAMQRIREKTGKFPVLVTSATTGIELALSATNRVRGKRVAVADFTHAGSIAPIFRVGATPIIAACDGLTMTIEKSIFEEICAEWEISHAVVVNPFGYGIDREFYAETARRYGVQIVFDYAGAWGDFEFNDEFPTVYSFHATKSLPIGEGGVVLFSNELEALEMIRRTNFCTGLHRAIVSDMGTNAKLSEVSCAVLAAQLDSRQYHRIEERILHRHKLLEIYETQLSGVLTEAPAPSLCVVPISPPRNLEIITQKALESRIEVKQYYLPLRKMPAYQQCYTAGAFSRKLDFCLALPSDCTEKQARYVVDTINELTN